MKDSKKTDPNKSDRILSFLQSREFTETELKQVAGAGEFGSTFREVQGTMVYDVEYISDRW